MKRLSVACALAVAGCSPQPETDERAAEGERRASSAPQEVTDCAVDFEATGISLPGSGFETGMTVPFGSNRAAAEHTLAAALGDMLERGENVECGAGPMQITRYDGVTLNFQDEKLVGWSAGGKRYLPDATRGAMGADGGLAKVEGSTLGEEYTLGGSAGPAITMLFDGPGENARVEHMWAGMNCAFR